MCEASTPLLGRFAAPCVSTHTQTRARPPGEHAWSVVALDSQRNVKMNLARHASLSHVYWTGAGAARDGELTFCGALQQTTEKEQPLSLLLRC